MLSLYIILPQFRPRCSARIFTFPSLGRGASLLCPPTSVKAVVLRSYVNLPLLRPKCFTRRSTYPSLLKPLSHQLATSGDALATNNFGHIANASPDVARRRQTTSVHCHHNASARQPSSTLRQAWRFFWNVQKNRQASPTVASEYSVVKWLSALRQPSPSYSSSSPMRR